MLNVTSIRLKLLNHKVAKAIVSVGINDLIVIHGITVVQKKGKLNISMPFRKTSDGKYEEICHPMNVDARRRLTKFILDKYKEELNKSGENNNEDN